MKRFLSLLFAILNINCIAFEEKLDWIDHFVLAEQAISIKDGNTAIDEFSKAIELNPDELILYVQRGNVHIKKHQYEEAAKDFTHVIDSPNPHVSVLLPAVRGRASCYLRLDGDACFPKDMSRTDRFHLDFDRAASLDPYPMFSKENERYEITANIPPADIHSQDYREAYIDICIQFGVCNSRDDVKFFDNGIAVTKLKKKCDCGCQEARENLKKKT